MKKTEQKTNMHVFKTAKDNKKGKAKGCSTQADWFVSGHFNTLIICRVKAEALCRQDTGVIVIVELAKHLHTAQTNAL